MKPPWQAQKLKWEQVIQQKTDAQKPKKNERRRYNNGWTIVGIGFHNETRRES